MKTILLLLSTLLSATTFAQSSKYDSSIELRGSGRIVRETPTVAWFDGIEISQFPAKIRVDVGGTERSVDISVDDNLRSMLRVESQNGTLKLSFIDPQDRPFWISKANLSVRITTPTLKRLKHGSNSDVLVAGLSGASFDLVNEANGNVTLRGKANTLNVISSANGTIDASELTVQTANVMTEANATVRVNAQSVKTTKQAFARVVNVASRSGESSMGHTASAKSAQPLVTVQFQNNSARQRTVTLISYAPGDEGNETNGFTLAPYANRQKQYAIGTAVYVATKDQVDLVMSGGRLRGKPLLTVDTQDEGRTIKLNK